VLWVEKGGKSAKARSTESGIGEAREGQIGKDIRHREIGGDVAGGITNQGLGEETFDSLDARDRKRVPPESYPHSPKARRGRMRSISGNAKNYR